MRFHKIIFILFTCVFSRYCFTQNADIDLLRSMNGGDNADWDQTMKYTSVSVYPAMGLTVGGLLVTGYVKKDKELVRNGYKAAIAMALSEVLAQCMKYSVQRARPYTNYPNNVTKRTDASGYSFPSGHTSVAFSTATALTLSTKKWYVAVPAFAYAGLVGYSRLRLGVHYPSDVLGGMVTGIGSALITWQADKWLRKKKEKKRPVQMAIAN